MCGHDNQTASCGAHSAGIRNPREAGVAGTRGEEDEAEDFFADAGLADAAFLETGLAEAMGMRGQLNQ